MTPHPRTPVTVVTGALGAGKTSLVNHLIRTSGRRLAVIVNEFGAVGIDGDLIESGAEELIELNAGCVCCVVRGDLIRALRGLPAGGDFDAVVIETTGLANPAPVIQSFLADQQLAARYRLDAVVTVVDALHIGRPAGDAADQIALASVIVLNKARGAADVAEVERLLRALNPFVPIHRAERGRIGAALVLDTHGFDLDRIGGPGALPEARHDHGPDGIAAVCLTDTAPLDAAAVERWLSDLLARRGADILRTKGILWAAGEDRQLVVQAVHMMLEGDFAAPWPAGPRTSRLVFIGRNLDTEGLQAGLCACRATATA